MGKLAKKQPGKKQPGKRQPEKKQKAASPARVLDAKKAAKRKGKAAQVVVPHDSRSTPPLAIGAGAAVLDRLWSVVTSRRDANPALSHSARLLSRGTEKIAQKFGEEAVECLIEAVIGNRDALVAESADVLYHLLVLWVDAGIRPEEVWGELQRREGVSGIAEKASRARKLPVRMGLRTTKIP
jgi:phosphoribosyl-ATP pyrophosphohydrolase